MFHWVSDNIVSFKIEVGVEEKTLNIRKMVILAAMRRPIHAVPLMKPYHDLH